MNKLLTQKEYWDNVAEEKEFTTPFQMELFKKNVSKEARILDVKNHTLCDQFVKYGGRIPAPIHSIKN